jgi:hypothetical protein
MVGVGRMRVLMAGVSTVLVASGVLVTGVPAQADRTQLRRVPPSIAGLAPVAPPDASTSRVASTPQPLPRRSGSVPVSSLS